MKILKLLSIIITTGALIIMNANAETISGTNNEDFSIAHLGHGSLRITVNNKVIQVDPYSEIADYSKQPKADLVLITHDHYDHFDKKALDQVVTSSTKFITSKSVAQQLAKPNITTLENGQSTEWNGIKIAAVPAYNIKHKKPDNSPFHPKGYGNGYVLTINNKNVYIAGDTEDIPEMANLANIDIAFLPKNLPYTMDDEMFVKAAKSFKPKELHPYHYSEVNTDALTKQFDATEIVFKKLPIEK